jgi:hypothetical protein
MCVGGGGGLEGGTCRDSRALYAVVSIHCPGLHDLCSSASTHCVTVSLTSRCAACSPGGCQMLLRARKFDIRIWVLVLDDGDVYMYLPGYIRTSSEEFSLDR